MVDRYRRFGNICCIHPQGSSEAVSPKAGSSPEFRTPSKGGPVKNFYSNWKRLSIAEWLGLVLKWLICTGDKERDHQEKQIHKQNSRAPRSRYFLLLSPLFRRDRFQVGDSSAIAVPVLKCHNSELKFASSKRVSKNSYSHWYSSFC